MLVACAAIFLPGAYAQTIEERNDENRASEISEMEQINLFDVTYNITAEGAIDTKEYIKYDFGQNYRHGIFRNIRIQNSIGKPVVISDVFASTSYTTHRTVEWIKYQIGNPDALVTGAQEYSLNYTLWNTLTPQENSYEFYWNVTGNQTVVPTQQVIARVILPAGATKENILYSCYMGTAGDTSPCDSKEFIDSERVLIFRANNLSSLEGLSIAVSFPKETINYIVKKDYIRDYGPIIIGIILLINFIYISRRLYIIWLEKGKDPEIGAIIPEYDKPKDVHVYELQFYANQNDPGARVSAFLIDLAIRGIIHIKRIDSESIFSHPEYEFSLQRDDINTLDEIDSICIRAIFKNRRKQLLSEIPNIVTSVKRMDDIVKKKAEDNGNYLSNVGIIPKSIIWKHVGVVGLCIIALLAIQGEILINVLAGLIILATAMAIVLFLVTISRFTEKGTLQRRRVSGLIEYLSIAEKDRLAFHNAPEKNPQVFEKLLAPAIALRVDKLWAKEFADIEVSTSWYDDVNGNRFTAGTLVGSMSNIESKIASVSAPQKNASSGGGRSGGGGGGGGTGSW